MREIAIFDLHSDYLSKSQEKRDPLKHHFHSSPDKLRRGGVKWQVFSLFSPKSSFRDIASQIELALQLEEEGVLRIVRGKRDLTAEEPEEPIKAVLLIEGLCPIGEEVHLVKLLWRLGVRVFGIAWNRVNPFGSGAIVGRSPRRSNWGLGPLSGDLLETLRELGGIIDISHLSYEGVEELLHRWNGPLLASHSNLTKTKKHPRNLPDDLAREVVRRGGVVGITFPTPFLPGNSVKDLLRAFEDALEVLGPEGVAIGSDFDGTTDLPRGLEDAEKFPGLIEELRKAFGEEIAEKVAYENAREFFSKHLP